VTARPIENLAPLSGPVADCPLCLKTLFPDERRGRYFGQVGHFSCVVMKRLDEVEAEQERMADLLERTRERVSGIAGREKI
jgi:hypothetical protein